MSDPVTFAGVADKTLDKLSGGIDRVVTDAEKFASVVIKEIEKVAPKLAVDLQKLTSYAWHCLIKQVMAEGIFYSIGSILLPTLFFLLYKKVILPNMINSNDDDRRAVGLFITILGSIAVSIITFAWLYWGIMYLVSPEYYAVFNMIEKLNTPKQ